MTLRPDETIQKSLLSTTSRLTGEYEVENVLLTHAWVEHGGIHRLARITEGPASRSGFILTFRTDSYEKLPGVIVPNYSYVGDHFAALLSVFYGKRFDNHGLLENSGMHSIPDTSLFSTMCESRLHHNTHVPRVDFSIPLNLSELRRVEKLLLFQCENSRFSDTFFAAANFYHQALQNFERQPEVAYLHFITAGEIISNYSEFSLEELLDEPTLGMLEKIKNDMVDGHKFYQELASRFKSIKRRFVLTLVALVDEVFFNHSDMTELYGRFEKKSFRASVAAAYDLRSKHVHTGRSLGNWVMDRTEVMSYKPVVGDKDFKKILCKAPTLMGLERIIRYCLLRFAETNGIPIRDLQEEIV